jgi:hypothetical protein
MKSYILSAVLFDEASHMAWEAVTKAHPERADEITLLSDEIRRAMAFILKDPKCYSELLRRVRASNREMECEFMEGINA